MRFGRRKFKAIDSVYMGSYFSNYINQFMVYFYNSNVATLLNFEILSRFSTSDFIVSGAMKTRLVGVSDSFSTIFFYSEFADIMYLAFKIKSFKHLISYLNRLLKSLVFWDHKKFLVFVFETIREQFYPVFSFFHIVGLHASIKGKIGVGGDSRKRRMHMNLGKTTRVQK